MNKETKKIDKKDNKIQKLTKKITSLEKNINSHENKIEMLNRYITKVKTNLKLHINRQTAEIQVVEKDGSWGDYTGVFYLDIEDEKEVVLAKAKRHYEKYFKNGDWYEHKTLGLFINTPTGKKLIEVLKNTGHEVKNENEI